MANVFADVEGVDQHSLLEDHPDGSLVIDNAFPVDPNVCALERAQVDEVERDGRFSGPRISLEPETFTFFQVESDVFVLKRATVVGRMDLDS